MAVLAVAKLQLRILRNDPWFVLITLVMPLIVMPLFERTMRLSLAASGFTQASGAEQVVPGQVVLFGFFVAGSAGFSVFREHGWRTWDRLRASAVSARGLLAGFACAWTAVHVLYQGVLFAAGGLALGLRLHGGSALALTCVMLSYALCSIAIVLAAAATLRTVNQMNAFQNVAALAFAGLGGAIVPIEQLPAWARAIAPVTPAYWAMRGFHAVFLERGGLREVAWPCLVLGAASCLLGLFAARRFRADETKEFFA